MDHEAEEVLNELNLLTESEADTGGQGDDYPVGELAFTWSLQQKPMTKS